MYHPSSPLRAIKALAPRAEVQFAGGEDCGAAAGLTAHSDVAIVFVTSRNGEAFDGSLTLPGEQDALVSAVARANPRTILSLRVRALVHALRAERPRGT